MGAFISINRLTKVSKDTKVLDEVSLDLSLGQIVGIVSPRKSGKSSLMNILSGVDKNYEGDVIIDNKYVGKESKKHISFMSEHLVLDLNKTIKGVAKDFQILFPDFSKDLFYTYLKKLNYSDSTKLNTLSRKEARLVQLSLVLSRITEVYLLDEPVDKNDPDSIKFFKEIVTQDIYKKSLIIITSSFNEDIFPILNIIIFFKNGKVNRFLNSKQLDIYGSSVRELYREAYLCF